jgi:hypothetical protein
MRSVHGPRMRDRLFTILQTVVSRRVKQVLKTPTEHNPKQNQNLLIIYSVSVFIHGIT